jgi:dethiobiotin synthetase
VKSPLLVVTGTGTEIGKTHVSVALLLRWGCTARVVGAKPVETGVRPGEMGEDLRRLTSASTFHVKQALTQRYAFVRPVSPHLAARDEGATIDLDRIIADVNALRAPADGVLVELPGGLFSPLTVRRTNADLARALEPTATLLVAPDRLGVLHDVVATATAAASIGMRLTGVVLVAPRNADASTGTNGDALRDVARLPLLGSLPRASERELSESDVVAAILSGSFGARRPARVQGEARRPRPRAQSRRHG